MNQTESKIINEAEINQILSDQTPVEPAQVREILARSKNLKGLDYNEVAALTRVEDPELLEEIFHTARDVKNQIYGNRLVFFAPLYISNLCKNECLYCAFRARNTEVKRRALSQGEIRREVEALVQQGHKRILMVAGESYPDQEGFEYVLNSIDTIYSVKIGNGEIRRVNVNIAPLEVEQFRELKDRQIGTYQLFQETYHHETYMKMHVGGLKRNYDYRLTAMDRAFEAGIDDLGVGVLFGLYDYRFEILALMQHIRYFENKFGLGPHTISVPRMEPATGSDVSVEPPCPVDDTSFKKIVAILRLAVPYTGIIMSTRETPKMRRETFALGVSQISAGSRTNPGGYSVDDAEATHDFEQFSLGDHRPLDEVLRDVMAMGYTPSFCTACYRLGRTGLDFMEYAKPGQIKRKCDPNAFSTLMEYLLDYASPETLKVGEDLIAKRMAEQEDPEIRKTVEAMLKKVREGKRDVYI